MRLFRKVKDDPPPVPLTDQVSTSIEGWYRPLVYAFEYHRGRPRLVASAADGAEIALLRFVTANDVPAVVPDGLRDLGAELTAAMSAGKTSLVARDVLLAFIAIVGCETAPDQDEFSALLTESQEMLAFPELPSSYLNLYRSYDEVERVGAAIEDLLRGMLDSAEVPDVERGVSLSALRVNFGDFFFEGVDRSIDAYNGS